MSKYIDADLYVEMQIYDDEHEEWGWWKGTIEDLLDQWTEEGCPTPIEVSEDCISREYLEEEYWQTLIPKEMVNTDIELGINIGITKMHENIKNAPSVTTEQSSMGGEPKEDKMASVLSDMIDSGWKIQF